MLLACDESVAPVRAWLDPFCQQIQQMSYTARVAWSIIMHPEVAAWLGSLDSKSLEQVTAAVDRLSEEGPSLRRPLADTLTDTDVKNLKELRPGSSKRSEIRILFAFDLIRQAILLVAGDKADEWNRWYKRMIPIAEQRFAEHVARLQKGGRT